MFVVVVVVDYVNDRVRWFWARCSRRGRDGREANGGYKGAMSGLLEKSPIASWEERASGWWLGLVVCIVSYFTLEVEGTVCRGEGQSLCWGRFGGRK